MGRERPECPPQLCTCLPRMCAVLLGTLACDPPAPVWWCRPFGHAVSCTVHSDHTKILCHCPTKIGQGVPATDFLGDWEVCFLSLCGLDFSRLELSGEGSTWQVARRAEWMTDLGQPLPTTALFLPACLPNLSGCCFPVPAGSSQLAHPMIASRPWDSVRHPCLDDRQPGIWMVSRTSCPSSLVLPTL